jgi:trehalose 6-phosphate phosphatase
MAGRRGSRTTPPWPPPARGPDWAFFLDIDGTLVEHADRPSAVELDQEVVATLGKLRQSTGGAVALISGRSLSDVDALFAPAVFPAAGQHGAERRRADGGYVKAGAPARALRPAAAALVAFAVRHPGVLVEDKGLSVAVHYRRRPALREAVAAAVSRVAASLGENWVVQSGRLVYEIRPDGRDKGSAIAEFMAEPPFAGRVAVFVGDDPTDEHGFVAVNCRGGLSVKVGEGETAARWRLPDAAAVQCWLRACAEGVGPQRLRRRP